MSILLHKNVELLKGIISQDLGEDVALKQLYLQIKYIILFLK